MTSSTLSVSCLSEEWATPYFFCWTFISGRLQSSLSLHCYLHLGTLLWSSWQTVVCYLYFMYRRWGKVSQGNHCRCLSYSSPLKLSKYQKVINIFFVSFAQCFMYTLSHKQPLLTFTRTRSQSCTKASCKTAHIRSISRVLLLTAPHNLQCSQ